VVSTAGGELGAASLCQGVAMDEERLNRLTPRERDVYEAVMRHPDWGTAQIGGEVRLTRSVVRRYVWNIRKKLGEPDWPQEEP
jgi:FixJ family two-component response regulator